MTVVPPRYVIELEATPITIHTWAILAGLSELSRRRQIRLRIKAAGSSNRKYVMRMHVVAATGSPARVIDVDLADAPSEACPDADSAWVRSFDGSFGRPLGLVAGVRSGREPLISYARHRAGLHLSPRVLRRTTAELRSGRQFPSIKAFERSCAAGPKRAQVLYQTRAWRPSEGADPEARERVNESRAGFIRSLRGHLGARFIGGFLPSSFALERYPDLVTRFDYSPRGYRDLIHQSAIAVSTEGLHRSNPWKLAEYMAGACAIATEPLAYGIPESLEDSVRFFHTEDECVSICDELLGDREIAESWGYAAHGYWKHFVRPDELLCRRLSEEPWQG